MWFGTRIYQVSLRSVVWALLILFCIRFRMDEGSFIWVIEGMNANGFFRTQMDNGSIIFVIWARNYIGVA